MHLSPWPERCVVTQLVSEVQAIGDRADRPTGMRAEEPDRVPFEHPRQDGSRERDGSVQRPAAHLTEPVLPHELLADHLPRRVQEHRDVQLLDQFPERVRDRVKVLAAVTRGNRQPDQAQLGDPTACLRDVLGTAPRGDRRHAHDATPGCGGERRGEVVVLAHRIDVEHVELAVPDVRVRDDRRVDTAVVHPHHEALDVEHAAGHHAPRPPLRRVEVRVNVDGAGHRSPPVAR